jgi:hypothetical protein
VGAHDSELLQAHRINCAGAETVGMTQPWDRVLCILWTHLLAGAVPA